MGIFDASGATTRVWEAKDLEPPLRARFDYFERAQGGPRGVAPIAGTGPTWLTALVSLPGSNGAPRLGASYMKIKPPLEAYEWGLCVWDETRERFEPWKKLWEKSEVTPRRGPCPDGHAVTWKDENAVEWVLFGNPLPTLRCRASFEAWSDPKAWQILTPQETIPTATGDARVKPHSGSVAWNAWRRRWVTVFTEAFGKPSAFGEVWYAEAESPLGPWAGAVKVLSHENYTFYNPRLHPEFASGDSRTLYFEGTFSMMFADRPVPTGRHDYNQVLYRIDLADVAAAK
ncbi:MAG: hypothetical protein JNL97_00520 [Verrucomicrobiales bacterium]|nr:hypothetical protein [Verrucomicrobiales bacterium]